jgi:hypothetical protein
VYTRKIKAEAAALAEKRVKPAAFLPPPSSFALSTLTEFFAFFDFNRIFGPLFFAAQAVWV